MCLAVWHGTSRTVCLIRKHTSDVKDRCLVKDIQCTAEVPEGQKGGFLPIAILTWAIRATISRANSLLTGNLPLVISLLTWKARSNRSRSVSPLAWFWKYNLKVERVVKVKRYCELKVEVRTLIKVSKNKSSCFVLFLLLLWSELCVLRGHWTEIWKLRCLPY